MGELLFETRVGRFILHLVANIIIFFIMRKVADEMLIKYYLQYAHEFSILSSAYTFVASIDIIMAFFYDILDFEFLENKFGIILKNIPFTYYFIVACIGQYKIVVDYLWDFMMLIPNPFMRAILYGIQILPLLMLNLYYIASKTDMPKMAMVFAPIIGYIVAFLLGLLFGYIFAWTPFFATLGGGLITVLGLGAIIVSVNIKGLPFDHAEEFTPIAQCINFGAIGGFFGDIFLAIGDFFKFVFTKLGQFFIFLVAFIKKLAEKREESEEEEESESRRNRKRGRSKNYSSDDSSASSEEIKNCIKKINRRIDSVCMNFKLYKNFVVLNSYSIKTKVSAICSTGFSRNKTIIKVTAFYYIEKLYGEDQYTVDYNFNHFDNQFDRYLDDVLDQLEEKIKSAVVAVINETKCYEAERLHGYKIILDIKETGDLFTINS